MKNLPQAIKILEQARDNYAERLANWVVENEETLLSQSTGEVTFGNDEFFQTGEELRQVSLILSFMPRPAEPNVANVAVATQDEVSCGLWVNQIRTNNIPGAITTLSFLFQCDRSIASHCVRYFIQKFDADPSLFDKLTLLQQAMRERSLNDAIQVVMYCFGVNPPLAVHVVNSLQSTM